MRSWLHVLTTLTLAGCVPETTGSPRPDPRGQVAPPEAACVGDGDGVITAAEIPPVALDLGVRAAFLVDGGDTTLPAGWVDDGDRLEFDLSVERVPLGAGARVELVGPEALNGAWFGARFPAGEWHALIDGATDTRGIFARDGDDVLLLGIASATEGDTALLYEPPVPLFPLPMADGDSWEVAAAASGIAEGQPTPLDLGPDGVVSLIHRWSFEVDGAGLARLPGADLPVLRLRLALRTEAHNSIAGLFAADSQRAIFLVAECLGTVARLRSGPDALDADFADATEVTRFGLSPELLP